MKTFLFVVQASVMIPLIIMMFFYMALITIFILPIEVAWKHRWDLMELLGFEVNEEEGRHDY